MRAAWRKILVIAVPAFLLGAAVVVTLVEVWVRLAWDERRGVPGFYLSDPVLGQRLAPGYEGWFAGTPVRINALGFRDSREYALEKGERTVRILVLGDSVTFGHGAPYETTYPRLLELRLKGWRPDVDWQVWNLGVPGFNTSQELAYLLEVGERYRPDLVVVGFFGNDFADNEPVATPGVARRLGSFVQRQLQRRLYSYELYRRVYLTARWRLRSDEGDRRRLEHLVTEARLLDPDGEPADRAGQHLTGADYFTDEQVRAFVCVGVPPPDTRSADDLRALARARAPEISAWLDAVRELQRLHQEGVYRIVFFVNMAPPVCPGTDRFYDAGSLAFNDALVEILGGGEVPVASSVRAFLHYRPSQMPHAEAHAMGNANRVKADVLFEFLKARGLPPGLPPAPGS